MNFEEYSELYDQFVGEDLPRLVEHERALEAENAALRRAARPAAQR